LVGSFHDRVLVLGCELSVRCFISSTEKKIVFFLFLNALDLSPTLQGNRPGQNVSRAVPLFGLR
jgi:hypothetical protein